MWSSAGDLCNDAWCRDKIGIRVGGECNLVSEPNFGTLEMDWENDRAIFQLRDSMNLKKVISVFAVG